jgi:hypothetical protein
VVPEVVAAEVGRVVEVEASADLGGEVLVVAVRVVVGNVVLKNGSIIQNDEVS